MAVFEKIKQMNIDEFAEWLDKNWTHDDDPSINWFDSTYCQKCDPEIVYSNYLKHDVQCSWCELHKKCRFFQDMNGVPDSKQMVKMWLESETENNEQ